MKKKKKWIIPFFSFRFKSGFVNLHHRLSLAARQPLVSFGNIRQFSPPASVLYFQTQAYRIFHIEFEEGC